ncbi:TRAP transporter small permease [Sabulicella rubraurantiaca]|uniref:TRAP transporter small permease n=1 Tax=Sabulicella rubraurantiaca TaxID=2811429 RepID=UPI001A965BD1|nr:TRAP transporter small permease [Sabulicella rubraurantiaca]
MLRRSLDILYRASAVLAALSLLAIFLSMMAQVVLRGMGRQFPGADDFVAYLCVATTFFALAHTFKRGELIRVGLVIERFGPARRWSEAAVLVLAALICSYITFWTFSEAMFSREIEEVAQGTVPFLLWIPKMAIPLGAGILLIAVLDELVTVLLGQKPSYVAAAEERAARGDFSAEV